MRTFEVNPMIDRRVLGVAGAVAVVCAGVAWITLHAAERGGGPPPPAPSAPAVVAPLPGADTIHDDPTVAPDPKESADNNVSLPADI
jgi:hypothetical protein